MNQRTTHAFTDLTRYICAAVHWYPELREYIFHSIIKDEHTALVEALGIDMLTVVKHCIQVRRRNIHLLLLRSLVTVLVVIVIMLRLFFQIAAHPSTVADLFIGSIVCITIGLIGTWITVFIEVWNSDWRVVGQRFTPEKFKVMSVDVSVPPELEAKILDAQEGNVVIYSQQAEAPFVSSDRRQKSGWEHNPFVGLGWRIEGCRWFPQAVAYNGGRQEADAPAPSPFTLEEFYQSLCDAVQQKFGQDLLIKGRLYVHGVYIQRDEDFFPDINKRPCTLVDDSLVRHFMEHPTGDIAYYQCFHLIHSFGKLIFSLCLNCWIDENAFLHIHQEGFLLSPPGDHYYKIDRARPLELWDIPKLVWNSLRETPERWRATPGDCFRLLSQWGKHKMRHADIERDIKRNYRLDFGAVSGLRFDVCSSYNTTNRASKFFHQVNMEGQINKLLRITRQATLDFLDSKHIDTSHLSNSQPQSFFFNSGVIINGGQLSGENITVTGQMQQATSPSESTPQSNQASQETEPAHQRNAK